MLDVKLLREQAEMVKEKIALKNADPAIVDEFLGLDREWRDVTTELDNLRAEQKKLSAERNVEAAKANKVTMKEKEARLAELEFERDRVWMSIPNLSSDDTPVGKDESANTVVRSWGEPRVFHFEPKDHLALGESLGMIDTAKAGEVTGTRFSYLKADMVILEFSLMRFVIDMLGDREVVQSIANKVREGYHSTPFIPVLPPVMIRADVMQKMARLEPKDERFYVSTDDLYLIGSAEHTLGPIHMNETLRSEDLPLRYLGFSTSFRREAGSYGKDTRGILRVHQFDKLEMESFTVPEDGLAEQDFFVAVQEHITQELKLPYRVVMTSTGDQGDPDFRHIDIETWLPGQDKYRETHSADYMTDYQARRLGTRVRRKDGTVELAHMNDATAFAGRTLIAIMENYQTEDGKIEVPAVLERYVGKAFFG